MIPPFEFLFLFHYHFLNILIAGFKFSKILNKLSLIILKKDPIKRSF